MTKRQLLAADPDRPGLFALFHPSPVLARFDPLARRVGTLNSAKAAVQGQLRAFLAEHGIRVVKHISRGRLQPWELLAMIEQRAGCWHESKAAWGHVVQHLRHLPGEEADSRLLAMIRRYDAKGSKCVSEIDDDGEFKPLVDLAMQAPGTVLARALSRHWPDAFAAQNFGDVARLCWQGLRSYFDAPWFAAALAGGREKHFPAAIRRAVIEGNLESVLDEHFWYLAMAGGTDWKKTLAELGDSLRLRTSSIALHEAGPGSETMRLRCHAAVPLNEARAGRRSLTEPGADAGDGLDETPWRPEEVRRAFNSPFWPHMLVTTSIGQEGLDFHPWCRTLAHWDLCSEPVALEQREGRISRFAGLSIRRAIVAQLAHANVERSANESPWKRLAALASNELEDETGLSPWWVAPEAETRSLVFTIPGSEQSARRARLHMERALYRLVLGMPDQADLLELIAARESWDSNTIKEEKRERFLSDEEYQRLGAALNEIEKERSETASAIAAVRLLMLTGCRLSEIQKLQWENVDLEAGELRLPDTKTGAKVVYLGDPAITVLRGIERQEDNPWVIAGRKPGSHLTDLQHPWRRIRERAGLEDVRIHDLRHSFASGGLLVGEGLPMIGKLLGHTQVQTTARYAHLANDPVKSAANRIASRIAEVAG